MLSRDAVAKVGRVKRRIFIAIDLPQELKAKIAEIIKQWHWLPIRWLKPENWHLTLIPPVYLEDQEIELLKTLLEKRNLGKPLALNFNRVLLAPPGVPARMIWLEGDAPPELGRLKKKLENIWAEGSGLPRLKPELRPLHLHVTLARFESGELQELEAKTRVLGDVDFKCGVKEIVVMESHLQSTGAEYKTIAAIPLS